jgi:two-component system, cell cycle response regulator DivK
VAELVLIVDDDERNARLVRDVLEAAGMRTLSAGTAAAALALAREQRPDLVLMDLRLPDLDGAEAARRLRSDEHTAAIPVVALSAIRAEDAPWSVGEGFSAYVEKPVDVLELPGLVRRHIGVPASEQAGGPPP